MSTADREEQPALFAAPSALSSQAKPTAVISAPKRLAGRRHQANRPVPMNDHADPEADDRQSTAGERDEVASQDERDGRQQPGERRPASAEHRPAPGAARSSEQLLDALARELGLGDEPARARARRRAGRNPTSRGSRRGSPPAIGMAGDARGDVEAVDVGELDVEEHELRPQAAGLLDRARAVHRLADDVEALATRAAPRALARNDGWSSTMRTVQSTGWDSRHRRDPSTYGWPYNV